MTIAKKPNKNTLDIVLQGENKAEAFIAGASKSLVKKLRQNKQPIMIRFDPVLLEKVNEASRHRGVSRSSWIQYVISRALDHGEG
ncbi:MAG: hypothetical protein K2W92_07655 [Alphaproteobacteria bacterium]|nr:hypothetical protein [Alphaproteobacteria bacterium]